MPSSHSRNHSHLVRSMLKFGYSLCLLHKHRSVALMLELIWIAGMDRHDRPIYMQLTNKRALRSKLRPEGVRSAFSQSQQTDQNILFGIFIRNECFPSLIGHVISSNQLDIFRLNLEMHLFDTYLSRSNVPAGQVHFSHFGESQFSQIALLHSRCDQRHGDIPLDSVNPHPWRDQGQQLGNDFDQIIRMIVFVLTVFPQLIKSCSSNYQSGINLNTVRSKSRVFEKFSKTFEIPLHSHVGQVRHHVSHHFVCTIFGQSKGFFDCLDCMSSIGIPGNIFVDALDSNLKTSAPVRQQIRQMSFSAKIRSCLNGDSDTFGLTLL